MVEIEANVSEAEPKTEKECETSFDVTEIIDVIRGIVGNVGGIAVKPMNVKLDTLNVSVSKASNGEYGVAVSAKIVIAPK